ncbi:MAG: hypothetical protein ACE149_12435 [Armatimonadota bacterium]
MTDTYSLELFGKPVSTTGTTPNPHRFGGAWGYINGGSGQAGVSGLQQLGARFYWPVCWPVRRAVAPVDFSAAPS